MSKILNLKVNSDDTDNQFLREKINTSEFNDVEKRYLKLLKKKKKEHLPLTKSERVVMGIDKK